MWQDDSGTVDFNEFVEMMTGKMGERDTRDEIMKVFECAWPLLARRRRTG